MKQEASIWRLNEISVTAGVSLTDPQFLKALTTKLRPGISEGAPDNPATYVGSNPDDDRGE